MPKTHGGHWNLKSCLEKNDNVRIRQSNSPKLLNQMLLKNLAKGRMIFGVDNELGISSRRAE